MAGGGGEFAPLLSNHGGGGRLIPGIICPPHWPPHLIGLTPLGLKMFHWAAGVGWPVGRLVAWLGLHQVHYVISKISSILTGNTKDHFHSFLHFFLDKLHFDADSKAVLEIQRAIGWVFG